MTFYVGQKVVCVDASNSDGRVWGPGEAPKEGEVYTIVRLRHSRRANGEVLLFRELERCEVVRRLAAVRGMIFAGYEGRRFRPVVERKTDISIFTAMLNPANEQVPA